MSPSSERRRKDVGLGVSGVSEDLSRPFCRAMPLPTALGTPQKDLRSGLRHAPTSWAIGRSAGPRGPTASDLGPSCEAQTKIELKEKRTPLFPTLFGCGKITHDLRKRR